MRGIKDKFMRDWLKKYAGLIYISVATLGVALLLFCSDELPFIWETMGRLDSRWMWGCALCVALYLLTRAATLFYYLRSQGFKICVRDALLVMGVGQFYSAITPSSTEWPDGTHSDSSSSASATSSPPRLSLCSSRHFFNAASGSHQHIIA